MNNLFPGYFNIQKDTLERIVKKANAFLEPFGYTLQAEPQHDCDGRLGEYEMGSIFEKNIQIIMYPVPIRRYVRSQTAFDREWDLIEAGRSIRKPTDKDNYMSCVLLQTELTVWHEIGHALMEQIVDWMGYIDDFDELIGKELLQKYNTIIDEETSEEAIVEDFAWGMVRENGRSELKECFEIFFEKLNKLPA